MQRLPREGEAHAGAQLLPPHSHAPGQEFQRLLQSSLLPHQHQGDLPGGTACFFSIRNMGRGMGTRAVGVIHNVGKDNAQTVGPF